MCKSADSQPVLLMDCLLSCNLIETKILSPDENDKPAMLKQDPSGSFFMLDTIDLAYETVKLAFPGKFNITFWLRVLLRLFFVNFYK